MSIFRLVTLKCPACGADVPFKAVYSVNADRRPDFRDAIIDGSFQRQPCGQCDHAFRLDPDLTYLNVGRGQWIAAFPAKRIDQWEALCAQAQDAFDLSYGPNSSAAAQEIGAGLRARVVFGWAALREKLIAKELGIDDIDLELAKMLVLRGPGASPVMRDAELRLLDVKAETLVLAWLRSRDQTLIEALEAPKALLDDVTGDPAAWQGARDRLAEALFVDFQRLLLKTAA